MKKSTIRLINKKSIINQHVYHSDGQAIYYPMLTNLY
jgi:hypothetical protein